MRITNRTLVDYLFCKYKAYLVLKGKTGIPHDYDMLMKELAQAYRARAAEALVRRSLALPVAGHHEATGPPPEMGPKKRSSPAMKKPTRCSTGRDAGVGNCPVFREPKAGRPL